VCGALIARETVAMEKPAWAATSLIVEIMVSAQVVNVFVSGLSAVFVTAG
jgi:hypothetical protein